MQGRFARQHIHCEEVLMKNKMMMIGSLCLVLALGLVFAGCKDEFTMAEFDSTSSPKVTVTSGSGVGNEKAFLVTWDAVGDTSSYTVVFQPTGKKTIVTISSNTYNDRTYAADGTVTYPGVATRNVDKWNAYVTIDKDNYDIGTGKIGVMARSIRNDKNASIGWSETVTLK